MLKAELDELRFRRQRLLKAPSLPWLRSRLGDFRAVLDESVQKAALILRDVFGKITLVPVAPDTGRPYYLARTHLETLKLLEDPDPNGGSDPGSTSIGWWRCRELNPCPVAVFTRPRSPTTPPRRRGPAPGRRSPRRGRPRRRARPGASVAAPTPRRLADHPVPLTRPSPAGAAESEQRHSLG